MSDNRKRSVQIKFFVTPAEQAAIESLARSAPSLSDYMRTSALREPVAAAIERADVLVEVNALRAIRDACRPADMLDVQKAVLELTRLGNLQKHFYSNPKVPLDRIDAVAIDLKDAIKRVEETVEAALASARTAEHFTAAILRKVKTAADAALSSASITGQLKAKIRRKIEKEVWAGIDTPNRDYAASLLLRLDVVLEALEDHLRLARR